MTKGYFATCTVDHSKEYFNESFGISRLDCMRVRHMILFSHFSNTLRIFDIHGLSIPMNNDEAPLELITLTGDMKKFFLLTQTEADYEWGLLNFLKVHEIAKDAMLQYVLKEVDLENVSEEMINDVKKGKELYKLKKSITKFTKSFNSDEKNEEESYIDFENKKFGNIDFIVDVCIPAVKKANYHFPTYYKIVTGQMLPEDTFLNDIIKTAYQDPEL